MPLRCSILVLEVPNYYCRTSHQQQQQQQHQHPHPRPDQPLTTAVLLVSPSPAESSLASIPLDRVCVCTCVYLCNTRPQRQPSSQKSNLPSKAQYNKVRVKEEGKGEESLFGLLVFGRRPRASPISSPAVKAAISPSHLKRLRTQTLVLRTRYRPP